MLFWGASGVFLRKHHSFPFFSGLSGKKYEFTGLFRGFPPEKGDVNLQRHEQYCGTLNQIFFDFNFLNKLNSLFFIFKRVCFEHGNPRRRHWRLQRNEWFVIWRKITYGTTSTSTSTSTATNWLVASNDDIKGELLNFLFLEFLFYFIFFYWKKIYF